MTRPSRNAMHAFAQQPISASPRRDAASRTGFRAARLTPECHTPEAERRALPRPDLPVDLAPARARHMTGPEKLVYVAQRLEEAFRVLRAMPNHALMPRVKAVWPDTAPEAILAYGYTAVEVTRAQPSPNQIDRLDACLGWLAMVASPVARRVLWLRSGGLSWRRISRVIRRGSHEAHRAIYRDALAELTASLDKNGLI